MAKEYIEREAILTRLAEAKEWCEKHLAKGEFREGCIAALTDEMFNFTHNIAIPPADVVEVVRCKDCQYNYHCGCSHDFALHIMKDDDFCSYGKRKEGAEG